MSSTVEVIFGNIQSVRAPCYNYLKGLDINGFCKSKLNSIPSFSTPHFTQPLSDHFTKWKTADSVFIEKQQIKGEVGREGAHSYCPYFDCCNQNKQKWNLAIFEMKYYFCNFGSSSKICISKFSLMVGTGESFYK